MAAEKRVSKDWGTGKVIEDFEMNKTEVTSSNLIDVLLSIKADDITRSFIMTIFGDFNGKIMCNPYDTFDVPAHAFRYTDAKGKEVSNTSKFTTTIGKWIFNVYFLRDDGLIPILGYINETIAKKKYNAINQTLSYALMEDKITIDQMKRYLEKTQWFMPFETIIAPNHTEHMLTCTKAIDKKKKELYNKYKADIDAGKVEVAEKMEIELLDYAKEYIGDDPALDTLLSGGGGSFENNFKNMYVMRGAIKDPDPNAKKEYNVALSNYADGISADEYSLIANSLSAGPYARGKKTEIGGYWEKLFVSALQYVELDEPGTDCGTTHYITPTLTKGNIGDYMYNYIIEGNKLVELTSDNKDKYIGKKVKMRFSSMCKRPNGKICNCCGGNMLYRIGITNIGLACSQIASTLKNISMKAFHDSTISTTEIDPMKAFSLKD